MENVANRISVSVKLEQIRAEVDSAIYKYKYYHERFDCEFLESLRKDIEEVIQAADDQ